MSFAWEWVNSLTTTNRASSSISASTGTVYTYRAPTRGQIDANELRASMDSMSVNISHQWDIWRNYVRPIIDSLPAGARDTRWRTGTGLPAKIDALNYGVQGTTLFIFNDATVSKASGRYWDATSERPITIAEGFENIWDAIDSLDITSTTATPSEVDLSAVWFAIGNRYEDGSASDPTSLDARTEIMENYWSQIRADVYEEDTYTTWTLGAPLTFSIAKHLDYLLQIHNVAGWQLEDPANVSHDTFATADHTHPYSDILPPPASTVTVLGRGESVLSLWEDVLRLRYEIQELWGTDNWYTTAYDPVVHAANGSLHLHLSYQGSGIVSAHNPHALDISDIMAADYFQYIADYIGMSDYTSNDYPTYTSVNYITQNDDLTTAVSTLDEAIANISGFTFRREHRETRIGTPTQLAQQSFDWVHNMNYQYPVLQFIDMAANDVEPSLYTSTTIDVEVEYVDANTVRIWTPCDDITIIGLFGGEEGGGPLSTQQYVQSIAVTDSGLASLHGDVTFAAGSNITIQQSGQLITINSTGSGGTADHGALTGLTDDDHNIYLLVSGSRAMSGALNMGANNITNVALVDGVDVSNHAGRHEYDGSDPIDGDDLEVSYSPGNYPAYTATLGGHLLGIDAVLASLIAGGGCTLDAAYDFGGAGAGRAIAADTGPVAITNPDYNGRVLELHQDYTGEEKPHTLYIDNNAASGDSNGLAAASIHMTGSSYQHISTDKNLRIWSDRTADGWGIIALENYASSSHRILLYNVSPNTSYSSSITLRSEDTGSYIECQADNIYFDDSHRSGSTWSDTHGIAISAAYTEWDAVEVLAGGENSLFAAMLMASKVSLKLNGGSEVGPRRTVNFVDGDNISMSVAVADDTTSNVTINVTTSYSPSNYTAYAGTLDWHLTGIDTVLGTLLSHTHDAASNVAAGFLPQVGTANYILASNGTAAVWIHGDTLVLDYAASNYSPYTATLEGHLIGIDSALSGLGGGGTLDTAYDFGGAGSGADITADSGAVTITVSDTSGNAALILTQNDSTNDPNVLEIVNNTDATDSWSDDGIYYPSLAAESFTTAGASIKLSGSATVQSIIAEDAQLTVGGYKDDALADYVWDSCTVYTPYRNLGNGTLEASTLITSGFFPYDSADPYSEASIKLQNIYTVSGGTVASNILMSVASAGQSADTWLEINSDGLSVDASTITLDTCTIAADGSEINNLLHIDYGSTPTTATWASNTLTANFSTGKPIQIATIDDTPTSIVIGPPDGINGYSLVIYGPDDSAVTVDLSALKLTISSTVNHSFNFTEGSLEEFTIGLIGANYVCLVVTLQYCGLNVGHGAIFHADDTEDYHEWQVSAVLAIAARTAPV